MTDERDYTRYRIGKPLAMDGHRIEGVGEPQADDDAATKGHVDRRVADLEAWCTALEGRLVALERGRV